MGLINFASFNFMINMQMKEALAMDFDLVDLQ